MSWLSSNLTSSFAEFTSQLSSLTGDVLPAGVLPDGEAGDTDHPDGSSEHAENGVTAGKLRAENGHHDGDRSHEPLSLPVVGSTAPTSEYQDVTFSPIKDSDIPDGGALLPSSTPNASAADFAEFLGDAGSFVGEPPSGKRGDGAAVHSANSTNTGPELNGKPDVSGVSEQTHDLAVPEETSSLLEKLKQNVKDGEARISALHAEREKDLCALRESHRLKLQAAHEHQQTDLEEMEQRISELETQRQTADHALREQRALAEDLKSSASSESSGLQATVNALNTQLCTMQAQLDDHQARNLSLEAELAQRGIRDELRQATERLRFSEEALATQQEVAAASLAKQHQELDSARSTALASVSVERDQLQALLEDCQLQLAEEKKSVHELLETSSQTAALSEQLAQERARCADLGRSAEELQAVVQATDGKLQSLQTELSGCKVLAASHSDQLEEYQQKAMVAAQEHTNVLSELSSLRQAHSSLQDEVAVERKAAESLRSSSVGVSTFEDVQMDLERCRQQLSGATQEIADLKEAYDIQLQQHLQTIERERAELQQCRQEFAEFQDQEKMRHAQHTQACAQLEAAVQFKESELEGMRAAVANSQEREASLLQQIDQSQLNAAELSEQHSGFLAELSSLRQAHSSLHDEMAVERNTVESLRSSSVGVSNFEGVRVDLERCQQQLSIATKEIADLKEAHSVQASQHLQTIAEERSQLQQCREEFTQQLRQQKAHTEELATRSSELTGSLQVKDAALLELQSQLVSSQAHDQAHQQQLEALRAQLEEAQEQHQMFLDKHTELSRDHSKLQEEMEAERKSMEAMHQLSTSCSGELEQVKAMLLQRQQEVQAAEGEIRALKDTQQLQVQQHVQSMADESTSLQRVKEDLAKQLVEAQAKHAALLKLSEEMRTGLASKDQELAGLLRKADESKAREAELTAAMHSLQVQCQATTEEHSKLVADHDQLCQSHSALQQQLAEGQSALQSVKLSTVDAKVAEEMRASLDQRHQQLVNAQQEVNVLKENHKLEMERLQQSLAEDRACQQEAEERLRQQLVDEQEKHQQACSDRDELQAKLDNTTQLYSRLKDESVPAEETGRQQRESERLRQHLLLVEEQHTQDLLDSEKVSQDLREELGAAQQAGEARLITVEEELAHCHQELLSLQEQGERVAEERNTTMQQCAETEKKAEASGTALARLQLVLEQFQKDHEKEVSVALEPLQSQLRQYGTMVEEYKAEISQQQKELAERHSIEGQLKATMSELDSRRVEVENLKATAVDCQTALDICQDQLRQCKLAAEGKVDANLVRNLLLTYLTARAEKQHEVLRPVASILGFSGTDMKKMSSHQGSWLSSWLGGGPGASQAPIAADKTFTELFVAFLEAESSTDGKPAPGQTKSLPPSALKDGLVSTSDLPASAFTRKSLAMQSDGSAMAPLSPPLPSPSSAAMSLSTGSNPTPAATPAAVTPVPVSQQGANAVITGTALAAASTTSQSLIPDSGQGGNSASTSQFASLPSPSTSQSDALRTILAADKNTK